MMKKSLLTLMLSLCQVVATHTEGYAQIQNQNSEITIAIPSKQYLMEGVKNRIYVQTFMKHAFMSGDIVRFEGDAKYAKGGQLERYATITNPSEGGSIEVKLYDGKTFEVKERAVSQVVSGDPAAGGGKEVRVQFLGDSFTKGCYFKDAFLVQGYVPNVKLVGTRRVPEHEGHYHEGRGGWTLFDYFSKKVNNGNFHNPYFQPNGELRYWGSTSFWKKAYSLNKNGGEGVSFVIRYDCGDYDTNRFGEDGLLVAPTKNDMMYDSERKEYIVWSGRAWKTSKEPADWDFDFGKYLDMWELESPDFLIVMLGLNDFRDAATMPIDFTEWNRLAEKMLISYRQAVPNGKLLLSTPCTSCGTLDNEGGNFTTRQNAIMWYVRANIIEIFDRREAEGIYVVDASATIDNEKGYNMKDGIQVGNPHPYPNYPQLGVPLAACVQYLR